MTRNELIESIEHQIAYARAYQSQAPVERVLSAVLKDLRNLVDEPAQTEGSDLCRATEAAKLLGYSTRWLYKHVATLPFALRFDDGAVRFSRRGIAEYIESHRQSAAWS